MVYSNHFSNGQAKHNPGQGTRSMANYQFIGSYVSSKSELLSQLNNVDLQENSSPSEVISLNLNDDQKEEMLNLVTDDNHTYDVAFWFYVNQCTSQTKSKVQNGDVKAFLTECVGGPSPQKLVNYFNELVGIL